jgi:osmoprotectant transport system substrate-binding protein
LATPAIVQQGVLRPPPLTLAALVNDQVQVTNLFSSDPSIAENDLVVLEDVKNLFSAQNTVPVIASSNISDVVTTSSMRFLLL